MQNNQGCLALTIRPKIFGLGLEAQVLGLGLAAQDLSLTLLTSLRRTGGNYKQHARKLR